MKVSEWLAAAAKSVPGNPALIDAGQVLSYAELDARVERAAGGLQAAGVAEGDVVATSLAAGSGLVVLIHAAIRCGATIAPLDPQLPQERRRQIAERIRAVLSIDEPRQLEQLPSGEVVGDGTIELERPLCLIHTSGSTGEPRPVELSAANHLWSAVGCGMRIGLAREDRWLCCLPMHHVGGFAIAIRSAIYGSAIVIEGFEAERSAATIASGDVTIVSLVATMLERVLSQDRGPGDLRCALLGGGPAPAGLVERALEQGFPVAPTYGLTETCSQVTALAPAEAAARPDSAGLPIASTRISIGDDGHIMVSGQTVAPAEAASGWLRTNDLGRIDADGYLYVLGRADQVIITGGENVSPEEVERVLLEHPDVVDAAVFGRDDPQWQRAVFARVVLRDSTRADSEQLTEHCSERLPGYKVPKGIELVAQLPRSSTGKLLRAELV